MTDKITITINPKNWTATVEAPDEWTVNLKPFWNGKGMHLNVHAVDLASQPDPDEGHREKMRRGLMEGMAAFVSSFVRTAHSSDDRQPFTAPERDPDDGAQGVH